MGWFVAIFFSVRGNADAGLVVLCMAISLSAGALLCFVFVFFLLKKKKNFRQSERVFQTHTLVCFHFFCAHLLFIRCHRRALAEKGSSSADLNWSINVRVRGQKATGSRSEKCLLILSG